jgi:hypothetical protein
MKKRRKKAQKKIYIFDVGENGFWLAIVFGLFLLATFLLIIWPLLDALYAWRFGG